MTAARPVTDEELVQWRETREEATGGRWMMWGAYPCGGGSHPKDDNCVHVARIGPAEVDDSMGIVADGGRGDLNGSRADFTFINLASREWLRLLALVDELRRERAGLKDALAECVDQMEWYQSAHASDDQYAGRLDKARAALVPGQKLPPDPLRAAERAVVEAVVKWRDVLMREPVRVFVRAPISTPEWDVWALEMRTTRDELFAALDALARLAPGGEERA